MWLGRSKGRKREDRNITGAQSTVGRLSSVALPVQSGYLTFFSANIGRDQYNHKCDRNNPASTLTSWLAQFRRGIFETWLDFWADLLYSSPATDANCSKFKTSEVSKTSEVLGQISEEQTRATWEFRLVHETGVECARITMP
jgi:hypothetical protein